MNEIQTNGESLGNHSVLILEERQLIESPIDVSFDFEFLPFLYRENQISVREVEVLTEQPTHSCLASEWIVTNNHFLISVKGISDVCCF